jgi:mannitol/fructose-specific phosphotransferase system IIA component
VAALATDPVLAAGCVHLGRAAADKADAIEQCGRVLVEAGAVEEPYVAAMHERETVVSTFIGEQVAIPHGTDASRVHVKQTRLGFLQFPGGVDWGGNDVRVCIPIASSGDEHVQLLSALAAVLLDPDKARTLREASDVDAVLALLNPVDEENPV